MKEKEDNIVLISTLSGLCSAAVAKVFIHPIDTIKSNSQIIQTEHVKMSYVLKKTIQEQGYRGLFKGLPITVLGSFPGGALYFGSYEYAKKNLLKNKIMKNRDGLSHFLSGMWAEAVSCIFWVPIDIIKERRQVQHSLKEYHYKSDFHALRVILKTEGVRGIYRAYMATIGSFGPTSALYFMLYEYSKGLFVANDSDTYLKKSKDNEVIKLTFYQSVICSVFASGMSAFITTPLDLVKFRMQVSRASSNYKAETAMYKNMIQGLYRICSDEGFKALYRGAQARTLTMIPMGTLTMCIQEYMKPIVAKIVNN